ncbi:MAG: response regulator [Phycisphaerales bacterium]|nr:response regulator [Phycisphaerales bacterium]
MAIGGGHRTAGGAEKPGSRAPEGAGRLNTLGLGPKELLQLHEAMDGKGEATEAKRKRGFVRWPFRSASVPLRLMQPGSCVASELRVACRNLSAGGMSVLHNSYLHTGSKVVVTLPHPADGPVELEGTVNRCRHVRGVVHEIGIQFKKSIQARDFVRLDPFSDCFSLENVKAEDLKGVMVHLDDSAMDQKLVRHFLRETRIRLRSTSDAAEAMQFAREGCDLILTDYYLEGMDGAAFVAQVRAEGIGVPVILATSDTSMVTRSRLSELNVNAFLTKPISQNILMRAIAEFMMDGAASGAPTSSLPREHPNHALVAGFVEQLRLYARQLAEIEARDDAAACRTVCLQIKGSAPAVGFEMIAELADEAVKAVTASMSVAESARQVRALIAACGRAR